MQMVTIDDVRAAAERIDGVAVRTPLVPLGDAHWVKAESLQRIGAFKIRGAYNAIAKLSDSAKARGVVAYSSGNHAQAVAAAAKAFGVPAVVVIGGPAPELKVAATRAYGAEVTVVPAAERESTALSIVEQRGATLIAPFDHPDVVAGQGTVGLEIAEDLPEVDVVLVPISGGGLASGIGVAIKALRPQAKVIGVEPAFAADTRQSLHEGRLVDWPQDERARTIADGLRSQPSEFTFAHLRATLDDVVAVSEDEIRGAVAELARGCRLIAEPSGAVATAAYLYRRAELPAGRTVSVLSGGNIDPKLLVEILSSVE